MSWIVEKANTLPYECADILSCVAMTVATVRPSSQPNMSRALKCWPEECERKWEGSKTSYNSTKQRQDKQRVRSVCRRVTQVGSGYSPEDASHWTLKLLCRLLHSLVRFLHLQRFCYSARTHSTGWMLLLSYSWYASCFCKHASLHCAVTFSWNLAEALPASLLHA